MNRLQAIVQRCIPVRRERRMCANCAAVERIGIPGLMPSKSDLVIDGQWCCCTACAERALRNALASAQMESERATEYRHRIPLGLLLLSRGVVRPEVLREALALQRERSGGLIGECLRKVADIDERAVTAALSAQWGCPVLHGEVDARTTQELHIPVELLLHHQMVPVHWNRHHRMLHVGFLRAVEHRVLAALESVLQCRAEACLITSSDFRRALPENGDARVALFSSQQASTAMVEAIFSYGDATGAQEVRTAATAGMIWARLISSGPAFDLLFATKTLRAGTN